MDWNDPDAWYKNRTKVVPRLPLTKKGIIALLQDPSWKKYGIPKCYFSKEELKIVEKLLKEGKAVWRRVSHLGQCLSSNS